MRSATSVAAGVTNRETAETEVVRDPLTPEAAPSPMTLETDVTTDGTIEITTEAAVGEAQTGDTTTAAGGLHPA